jgi:hypothetical protein
VWCVIEDQSLVGVLRPKLRNEAKVQPAQPPSTSPVLEAPESPLFVAIVGVSVSVIL